MKKIKKITSKALFSTYFKELRFCIIITLSPISSFCQNTATASGNWNDCSSWGNPTRIFRNITDTKTINSGITITANENWSTKTLQLNGDGAVSMSGTISLNFVTDEGDDRACVYTINCGSAVESGSITDGTAVPSGVYSEITHTGGDILNPGIPNASSLGVTGLTASFSYASSGKFRVTFSGTPSGAGIALFNVILNGQVACTLSRRVAAKSGSNICSVKMSSTTVRSFMCHNLGANTNLNPFDMSQSQAYGLQGGYIIYGRKGPSNWATSGNDNTQGFRAPPTATSHNGHYITSSLPDIGDLWYGGSENSPTKVSNDPCPSGFRVPTSIEWQAVIDNNTFTRVGTWGASPTNYTAGFNITTASGTILTLPANGGIATEGPTQGNYISYIVNRGNAGEYWTSARVSVGSKLLGKRFFFANSGAAFIDYENDSRHQQGVRCIKE